ncbi:hypothetical protein DFH29DRAFT_1073462 [Suillus ampliporus]|nr:hypothetical protein DFH29DRAFT_1073462 [Suillus ampliporus]
MCSHPHHLSLLTITQMEIPGQDQHDGMHEAERDFFGGMYDHHQTSSPRPQQRPGRIKRLLAVSRTPRAAPLPASPTNPSSATAPATFKTRLRHLLTVQPVHAATPLVVDIPFAQGKERNAAAGAPRNSADGYVDWGRMTRARESMEAAGVAAPRGFRRGLEAASNSSFIFDRYSTFLMIQINTAKVLVHNQSPTCRAMKPPRFPAQKTHGRQNARAEALERKCRKGTSLSDAKSDHATLCYQFIDAYKKGLNGTQAAWAIKKISWTSHPSGNHNERVR